MKPIDYISTLLLCFLYLYSGAQTLVLKGRVIANEDLVGIHVLNISEKKYAVTNGSGGFEIPVRLNDTIVFRSVQYEPYQLTISETIIRDRYIEIQLKDRINKLDEVVVGKILTGNLLSDIENSDAKRDINFYDLGIPGYTGKLKTQSERKFEEADSGKFIYYYGIGVAINVHKILNRISGRTKEMKHRVLLEAQLSCMNRAKSDYAEILFGTKQIEDHLIAGFFYYVAEDKNFETHCNTNNSMAMYEFLVEKLLEFENEVGCFERLIFIIKLFCSQ